MTGELRAGAVAAAAGVNRETLRYYERRGIIAPPERTLGGHRLYPAETVTTLRVIKAAQRLGFSLAEIEDLLSAGTPRHGRRRTETGLHERAATKLAEIEHEINDLTVIAATLRTAIDAGCDDLIACEANACCPIPFAELATEEGTRT